MAGKAASNPASRRTETTPPGGAPTLGKPHPGACGSPQAANGTTTARTPTQQRAGMLVTARASPASSPGWVPKCVRLSSRRTKRSDIVLLSAFDGIRATRYAIDREFGRPLLAVSIGMWTPPQTAFSSRSSAGATSTKENATDVAALIQKVGRTPRRWSSGRQRLHAKTSESLHLDKGLRAIAAAFSSRPCPWTSWTRCVASPTQGALATSGRMWSWSLPMPRS